MREHPILFSGPMVNAILAGRKTQTRRVVKNPDDGVSTTVDDGKAMVCYEDVGWMPRPCPYGAPGDRLWVREIHSIFDASTARTDRDVVCYRADQSTVYFTPPPRKKMRGNPKLSLSALAGMWKPSIFMPRWASRITLEVTRVRVERLQEINNEDAENEGMPFAAPHRHGAEGMIYDVSATEVRRDEYAHRHNTGINDCWICMFRQGWTSLNGKRGYGWDVNPFVWVIEFQRVN